MLLLKKGCDKMDCLFCKIGADEISSYTIFEDEKVKCFLDIRPDSNGHLLIIPKKHFHNLDDIDEETFMHIFKVSQRMKKELETKLKCDGLKFAQNNGVLQEVKHFHIHLIPYYEKKQPNKSLEEIYNILTL